MMFQHNERWIILGDLTNSTHFLHILTQELQAQPLFEVTSHFNTLIEQMYRIVEYYKPETAALANTMGDGFLVAGMAGHGDPYIKYDFPRVLQMCFDVKTNVDELLIQQTKEIRKKIEEQKGFPIELPILRLKLCVTWGHILTSVGFNRYLGDCINYAARILSAAFPKDEEGVIVLTESYLELLPQDIRNEAKAANFVVPITVKNYPYKGAEATHSICKIPLKANRFHTLVQKYLSCWNLTDGMAKLSNELFQRGTT